MATPQYMRERFMDSRHAYYYALIGPDPRLLDPYWLPWMDAPSARLTRDQWLDVFFHHRNSKMGVATIAALYGARRKTWQKHWFHYCKDTARRILEHELSHSPESKKQIQFTGIHKLRRKP